MGCLIDHDADGILHYFGRKRRDLSAAHVVQTKLAILTVDEALTSCSTWWKRGQADLTL